MPARKFVLVFVTVVLGWIVMVGSLTIWQQKVTGDLTRIGRWSERAFGFHSTSAPFMAHANEANENIQIAVLGDSFSRTNTWQSILADGTGQTIRTWKFEELTCVKQWALATVASHPSVRTIVIETVERAELIRAIDRYDCSPDRSSFQASPATEVRMERSYWPLTMDLSYLAEALSNDVRENIWPQEEFRSRVVNVPLRRSDLFSNHRADRLLYFTDDEPIWRAPATKYALAASNLADLSRILQQRGVRLVVLIVPDKSNVYRSEMLKTRLPPAKLDLASMLKQQGVLAPELLAGFRTQAATTVDFYLPNDTHLSLGGFKYLGQAVTSYWNQVLGPVNPP